MRIRHLLGKLTPFLQLQRLLLSSQSGSVKILMYHGIPDKGMEKFDRQLTWLVRHYPFLSPDSFHAFLEGRIGLKKRHVLITFDDGFYSSRKATEQILNPLGIKAMFFIPVGFIDLPKMADWREYVAQNIFAGLVNVEEVPEWQSPMSWDDVVWLRSQGHGIGTHTVNHCCLSTIRDLKQLEQETIGARTRLKQILDEDVVAIAYPFGNLESINMQSFALIRKHYRYCYSGVRGANVTGTSLFSIRRDAVSVDDPPEYVGFLIEDGLGLYYRNKRKKLDDIAASFTCDCHP